MKRRTLLQTVCALPLGMISSPAISIARPEMNGAQAPDTLHSRCAGTDHAQRDTTVDELLFVAEPSSTVNTWILLDLAYGISQWYEQHVVFWSTHDSSHWLVKKMAAMHAAAVAVILDGDIVDHWDHGVIDSPTVIVVPDSRGIEVARSLANALKSDHPWGCAALVLNGSQTSPTGD